MCVCVRQWFRDVCHFVRNSVSFCSQTCWECSTWSYQCLDWYTVTAASLLKEKCTHGLCRFPIFYQHFFLTGFFRQSQSLLAHLGYYLKLQIITYHCMIHACLMVCTCKPDITRLCLDYYSTYFAIVVGYAPIHYVKACVLLVSQFHSNLPNDYQRFLTWPWHVAFWWRCNRQALSITTYIYSKPNRVRGGERINPGLIPSLKRDLRSVEFLRGG